MRERLGVLLRVAFLLAVAVGAWLGLRGRGAEVLDALGQVSAVGVVAALGLVLIGLSATDVLWLRLMRALGAPLPLREGSATFFVGQLGKYVPGSVWSLGAQATLARRRDVPPRVTVAAGLVFLGYHLVTGVGLGALAVLLGPLDPGWPAWVPALLLVGSVLGLLPPVVRALARRAAGRPLRLGVLDSLGHLALMALTWTAYAGALVLLVPGRPWGDVAALGAAFALSYALGVVVVLAPAGLGAREGLFVVLLTPLLGLPAATALAVLARVVHTTADGLCAAGWWVAARAGQGVTQRTRPGRSAPVT